MTWKLIEIPAYLTRGASLPPGLNKGKTCWKLKTKIKIVIRLFSNGGFFELGGGFEYVKFQSYITHQHWGPDSHSIHHH
jgi:hypothetical protein